MLSRQRRDSYTAPVAGRLRVTYFQRKFCPTTNFPYVRDAAPRPSHGPSTKANINLSNRGTYFHKVFPSLSGKDRAAGMAVRRLLGGWWKGWISSWRWWAPVEVIKGADKVRGDGLSLRLSPSRD